MKKGKIFLLAAAALVLSVCTLAGCALEPYDQLTAAIEKTNALTELHTFQQGTVQVEVLGQEVSVETQSEIRCRKTREELELVVVSTGGALGVEAATSSYYAEGFLYTELMGRKFRMALSAEEMMARYPVEPLTFAQEDILQSEAVREDGKTRYSATVRGTAVEQYLQKTLEAVSAERQEILPACRFGDVQVSFLIGADGYIVEQTLQFEAEISMEQDTVGLKLAKMTMSAEQTLSYRNPGKSVVIEVPDLSEYADISQADR